VGYGGRFINENCPEAIIGLIIQLVIGAGVGGSLICIVFLKMVSPLKNRHSMVCFSKHAVVSKIFIAQSLIYLVYPQDMSERRRNVLDIPRKGLRHAIRVPY